jgi:translation elongation factor EF-Tu-like GTPase
MSRRRVRASLNLLPPEHGGRRSELRSGYRSLARFEGSDVDYGFELQLDDDAAAPGQFAKGLMSFWAADQLPYLATETRFELREGSRIVGYGTVDNVEATAT